MKAKCFVCDHNCEGRGFYKFSYLGETVNLCGHHANKVMNHIKMMRNNEK